MNSHLKEISIYYSAIAFKYTYLAKMLHPFFYNLFGVLLSFFSNLTFMPDGHNSKLYFNNWNHPLNLNTTRWYCFQFLCKLAMCVLNWSYAPIWSSKSIMWGRREQRRGWIKPIHNSQNLDPPVTSFAQIYCMRQNLKRVNW